MVGRNEVSTRRRNEVSTRRETGKLNYIILSLKLSLCATLEL